MRTALKLLLVAATALAALAFTATNASAQLSVENEASEAACPALPTGCHVEFEAEDVPLFAHIPSVGELPQSNCNVLLEARIGPDGEGDVVEANLTDPHNPGLADCTREPCETDEVMEPWPIHINEDEPNTEEVTITFCLSLRDGDMTDKTHCTLHLPLVQTGHMQEVTANASNRCAEVPAVAIAGHFTSHEGGTGTEEIEIHHD
jgi:hypothetical protein